MYGCVYIYIFVFLLIFFMFKPHLNLCFVLNLDPRFGNHSSQTQCTRSFSLRVADLCCPFCKRLFYDELRWEQSLHSSMRSLLQACFSETARIWSLRFGGGVVGGKRGKIVPKYWFSRGIPWQLSAGRIHHVMRCFSAKKGLEKKQKLLQTWRLGTFQTSIFGITWCDDF